MITSCGNKVLEKSNGLWITSIESLVRNTRPRLNHSDPPHKNSQKMIEVNTSKIFPREKPKSYNNLNRTEI